MTYMDGESLMNTVLPPIRFVISQLLPQGLHVLAGAPKVGKSWLSLWLCLQVAKGEPAWDFSTTKGDVLYLCLEDSYSRIQNRLLDITDDAPPNLFFATMSEKLQSGLEQQIERFLAAHPDTVLIVIDTLQRIRGGVNDANPYASDYRDLGILKELAGVIDGKESIHPRQSSRLGKIRDLRERQKSPDDRERVCTPCGVGKRSCGHFL